MLVHYVAAGAKIYSGNGDYAKSATTFSTSPFFLEHLGQCPSYFGTATVKDA